MPILDHCVPVLDALVHGVTAQHRPPVALLEPDGVQRDMAGRAFELEGLDHRIRRRHTVEHAVKAVFRAVLLPVDVAPSAAVAHVELVDDHRQASWPEPLGEEIGIGERSIHEVARGVELATHVDVRETRLCGDLRRSHQSFPFKLASS